MARRFLVPTRAAVIGLLILTGLLGSCVWTLFVPHRYESSGPLTLAEAKIRSPIELPAAAHDIRIATFRQWIQMVDYMRFEAPVADCEAYAKALLPGASEHSFESSAGDFRQVPFNPCGFRDLSPFDVSGIKKGVSFGAGSSEPRIWVDKDRGIFYYMRTD